MRFRPLFPMLALAAIAVAALASIALPPTTANANPSIPNIEHEICLTNTNPCQDRLLWQSFLMRYHHSPASRYNFFRYVGNNHLWVKRSERPEYKYGETWVDQWRRVGAHGPDNLVTLHRLGVHTPHWFAVRDPKDGRLLAEPKSLTVPYGNRALHRSNFGIMYNGPYELWYRRFGREHANEWRRVEKSHGDIASICLAPGRYALALRNIIDSHGNELGPRAEKKLIWQGVEEIVSTR